MRVVEGAGRSAAGIGIALAALLLGCGSANADTVVPLPDGEQALTTATGIPVDLTRTGETAVLSPSLAANGMSRTAQLSGTTYATIPGATAGSLETGYLVGCQVDLSGGLSLGGDVYLSPDSVSPELNPSIKLGPGAVAVVKFGTKQLDPAAGAVGIAYRNRGIQLSGCGGFAQARAYSALTVTNDQGSAEVTLYGDPFSVG
ncbi:MspA family porin [Nocardia colli]|uniref:MspA family porin n=1 Tax=Nocardia colli TaxID=2545717 RepID=A0A5N0EGY9_9NOCA|nr:MspA family porin [Nocardia colli]KAA8888582.1 MspA family porin [Nocardia colli]